MKNVFVLFIFLSACKPNVHNDSVKTLEELKRSKQQIDQINLELCRQLGHSEQVCAKRVATGKVEK